MASFEVFSQEMTALLNERLRPLRAKSRAALSAEADGRGYEAVDLESEVATLLEEVGGRVVRYLVDSLDGGRVRNEHTCPQCRQPLRFVKKSGRTWGFLFGKVRVVRARFNCRNCHKGRAPLEHVWGMQGGEIAMGRCHATPRAQCELSRMSAAGGYQEAPEHLKRLTRLRVSPMAAWRYAQRIGKVIRQREAAGKGGAPFRAGSEAGQGA